MKTLIVAKHSKYEWERKKFNLSHEQIIDKYASERANLAAIVQANDKQKEVRAIFLDTMDARMVMMDTIDAPIKGYDLEGRNKNVLLAGEHLFDKPPLWGGDYMDKLVGKVDDHGFITNGYDSSWKITRMYDKQKYWRANDLKSKVAKNSPSL